MKHLMTSCILAFFLCSSCKKSTPAVTPAPPSFTGCRILQVVISSGDTATRQQYVFSYNDDGTVATIAITQANASWVTVRKFVYKPGSVIVLQQDNTGTDYRQVDSVVLDAQGRVVLTGYKDGYWRYYGYTYDSIGQMILATSTYNTQITTKNYLWKNGDMVRTGGTTYAYDSTLYKVGNINASISDLLNYGRGILVSKHLCRQYWNDTTSINSVNYKLDAFGNITQIVDGDASYKQVTDISYDCM